MRGINCDTCTFSAANPIQTFDTDNSGVCESSLSVQCWAHSLIKHDTIIFYIMKEDPAQDYSFRLSTISIIWPRNMNILQLASLTIHKEYNEVFYACACVFLTTSALYHAKYFVYSLVGQQKNGNHLTSALLLTR